ncbi:YbhB/YbcL family Raf kinase inhibitor-like protein [Piscirickettsia salmonis]|uniref:YbhB/YbcL family Raf kinase inhibitor-like protein n=1 Tax=Piscirickettsia salmonis TaxID=1238 RepID=UPI000F07A4F5|nr:YbhB/YbcL family Raf kinase inhibitor-like protein [Piscirickettsiaceae bacterium NZ-RLO2]
MKILYTAPLLAAISLNSFAMQLTSQDIQEGSRITKPFVFNGFGCNGSNFSPQLSWRDAPKGTKSFALTVRDPDAPTESGFWHWVVIDIPATTHSIASSELKKVNGAKEMLNDYGIKGYGGPCPPKGHGMHRYQFTVWALPNEKLDVKKNTSSAVIGFMLNANALDKARITATYVNE